jgi:hypothetical protein
MKPIHAKSSHPFIVGVGQITHRDRILQDDPSPSELARRAVEACVEDSGCSQLLREVDSISVVNMFWEPENPTGLICDMLGIKPAIQEYTSIGGNTPQWLVNRSAELCHHPEGPATVETYAVVHDRRNEPDYAVIIARLENGQRCFTKTADLFQAMETEEFVGKRGVVRSGDDAPNIIGF